MTVSNGSHAETSVSWLSLAFCCTPLASLSGEKLRRKSSFTTISWPLERLSDQDLLIDKDNEKRNHGIVHDQPSFPARPVALPETVSLQSSWKDRSSRKSFGSGRTSFSVRKRLWSDSSSRRPHISAPSDFRHLESSSFNFPVEGEIPSPQQWMQPTSPDSLRPLELRVLLPGHETSPILPHFGVREDIPSPPPAYFPRPHEGDRQLVRQMSYSSMSFHIPRKHIVENSPTVPQYELPPTIPARAPGRARAYTSPDVETIRERVASAMIEVELLQQQIDDVVERQSLYANSRPSTSHSMARTIPELEPMPSVPALPPSAPSFAERLNFDIERPQTAPIQLAFQSSKLRSVGNEPAGIADAVAKVKRHDRHPPPPLPLVLRPPLRKKKSFSRVSTWLFPGPEHNRNLSVDSVTNAPQPVKGRDGFYQCVNSGEGAARQSSDSIDTISTWETDDEERTVPTTWSLGSTPAMKQEEALMEQKATFVKTRDRNGATSVGVAI